MGDAVILSLGELAIVLLAGVLIGVTDRRHFDWRWLGISALLILVHNAALTRGFWLVPAVAGLDDNWNWSGKLVALAVTLAIIALPWFGWRASGMTLRQEQLGGALKVTVVLMVIYAVAGWIMGESSRDPESIAYQLTMPGIEEEIFYRGLLLLTLDRAFTRRWNWGGAKVGWSLPLNALLFGLVHGLGYSAAEGWSFDALGFALPFIGSIPAVWLRAKTGSVLLPVFLHNWVNVAFTVLPIR